jgi:hypothetical protein
MNKKFLQKNHITKGNIISKFYFNLIYFLISNLINYKNKLVLDFGGGLGFLEKKLIKKGAKVVVYDKVKELSKVDDYRNINFDIIIFCQVLMYIEEYNIIKIFNNIKLRNKNIIVITCFSQQTLINKIFAFLLGHSKPHDDTVLFPKMENKIFNEFFIKIKEVNFYLFKIIVSKSKK